MTKPYDTYFGGKGSAGVTQKIINQIPKHRTFYSGFLGNCAVMRHKLPAARNVGFDIDPAVYEAWTKTQSFDFEQNKLFVNVYNNDFLFILKWGHFDEPINKNDAFLYLDPPYLPSTRTSKHKYKHELTEADHVELLDGVIKLQLPVAISCYDNALYSEKLKAWRKISFNAQTRSGVRVETLYMNYPEVSPEDLHDTRYLGDNFREREKSKRRIKTIITKINNLTDGEKAILKNYI